MTPGSGNPDLVLPQVDETPWAHPFLTTDRIRRFRDYSEQVWEVARSHQPPDGRPLTYGFAVNMAQNMYKWAKLARKYGADATLYLNPQDTSALSRPEWEEFDGEFTDIFDGPRLVHEHPGLVPVVPCVEPPNEGGAFWNGYWAASGGPWRLWARNTVRRVSPVHALRVFPTPEFRAILQRTPTLRHEALASLTGMYAYVAWAELLARHDVNYIASTPFPAYASGKPYCIFSVGGDMQFDCGRTDDLGRAMRMAFAGARFILASNPHTLGHCRRFGLTNAVYLPYPMDTDTYCPGEGTARTEWAARVGGDVFVLTTARIDSGVKGHTSAMQDALFKVAEERQSVRFVFLGWGADAEAFTARAAERGLGGRVLVLPPVGKKRLLDYYRSCDIVLDQFVYGYLGATALEAASVGKPVVMKLRVGQYAPLYRNDVAPVEEAGTPEEIRAALLPLIDSADRRARRGRELREWLVRNHGEQRTAPLMLALLQFAAGRALLPRHMDNPLTDPLSLDERDYHERCRR